jgi:hypothetical protein
MDISLRSVASTDSSLGASMSSMISFRSIGGTSTSNTPDNSNKGRKKATRSILKTPLNSASRKNLWG